jgi:hypothetical protein
MSRIALHAIQPPGMNGDNRSLHIYQIVLAQSAHPFARRRSRSVKLRLAAVSSARARRLPPALGVFQLRSARLATSVPYLLSTCNLMTYMNLPEFTAITVASASRRKPRSGGLGQSFRTACSTCAASPA